MALAATKIVMPATGFASATPIHTGQMHDRGSVIGSPSATGLLTSWVTVTGTRRSVRHELLPTMVRPYERGQVRGQLNSGSRRRPSQRRDQLGHSRHQRLAHTTTAMADVQDASEDGQQRCDTTRRSRGPLPCRGHRASGLCALLWRLSWITAYRTALTTLSWLPGSHRGVPLPPQMGILQSTGAHQW